MKTIRKTYDLTDVIQTVTLQIRVKAWADRKKFTIIHQFTSATSLTVDYEDNPSIPTAQLNRADKSLRKIIEREKAYQMREPNSYFTKPAPVQVGKQIQNTIK